MKSNWVWVDNRLNMQKAAKAIGASSIIGIDTEYDSFRYFYEKLCLVQIKTLKATYLFDPFAEMDLASLRDPFANPKIIKVLHAGDNDVRILSRDYGFVFQPIFDTQKAAALLGYHHLSLSAIVQDVLGKTLEKTKKMQRSRWETRPLAEEQLRYATQDTAYLIELYRRLGDQLKRQGLEKKARECFQGVAAVKWTEKNLDPLGHRRISGYRELSKPQKNRLKDLYRWRFRKAKETNTAIFMVLSDQNLIDLARIKVHSRESLQKAVKLPSGRSRTLAPEIIELLNG